MQTAPRYAKIIRQTKETEIEIDLKIDGSGQSDIHTGIGFLDHMLGAFAKHSVIDLIVKAKGDLHIDMHHTVEDTGIVIGQAISKALDGFSGLSRFGHAYIPMDEAMSRAAMDLCNRPYLVWRVNFLRDKVGDMDVELFKEWFHAFAINSGACLHIECLYGENSHHIAESLFKATARAFRIAASLDPVLGGAPASTKGSF